MPGLFLAFPSSWCSRPCSQRGGDGVQRQPLRPLRDIEPRFKLVETLLVALMGNDLIAQVGDQGFEQQFHVRLVRGLDRGRFRAVAGVRHDLLLLHARWVQNSPTRASPAACERYAHLEAIQRPAAKASASSSRSSPQKISVPIANVGAPKMPSLRAASVACFDRRSPSALFARAMIGAADLSSEARICSIADTWRAPTDEPVVKCGARVVVAPFFL